MSRGRVLVVDDEPFIRGALQIYLNTEGFEVSVAESGAEAMQKLEERPHDACILDILMPIMNGIEVLRTIRERGLDVEIIVATGCGSKDALAEVRRLGAYDYLEKPILDFESTVLKSVLRAVERRRLRAEIRRLRGILDRERVEDPAGGAPGRDGIRGLAALVRALHETSDAGAVLRGACRFLCERFGALAAAAAGGSDSGAAVQGDLTCPGARRALEEALDGARGDGGPARVQAGEDRTAVALPLRPGGAIAALAPAARAVSVEDAICAVAAAVEAQLAALRAPAGVPS